MKYARRVRTHKDCMHMFLRLRVHFVQRISKARKPYFD